MFVDVGSLSILLLVREESVTGTDSTSNLNHASKELQGSTLPHPCRLDIQRRIRISNRIHIIPKTVEYSTHGTYQRMLQCSNERCGAEITDCFEDMLMATLDTIEGIGFLVMTGCRVEVRV